MDQKPNATPESNLKEDKKMTTPNANVNQPTETEKSLVIIRGMIKKAPALKLVEQDAKTGISFFTGKKRLCKVLNTKRGITIELNVKLPKELAELPEIENITAATAHAKHLGTMKHYFRSADSKLVAQIMTAAMDVFKAELKAAQEALEQEKKPEKQAVNN